MADESFDWVTDQDVFDITRKEVSAETIPVAQEIVALEAAINVETDLDNGVVSSANVSLLRRAVAWQAVWLEAHPDALETMDVQGVSQDGLSAQYASESAHFLAPLATRCIRRLSWRLAPLRARTARRRVLLDVGNRDSASRDDQYTWAQMGHTGRLPHNPMAERSGQAWR